ncbi:hypothetical protein HPA02_27200 [Bisbaumannia pacifica]|uniref:Uncharacterized protein n=1 Tax=Bisbaumannia pacifica TaxID=77098 RepID=A0A510XCL7_9GAMM|nr:hypothetical protein [Halomonas pacifica]GEK48437.1 hypothetical protein HPA02_27200 [Halomonas pacifica]
MDRNDNAAPEHLDADDQEADALFNEFAGEEGAGPQPPRETDGEDTGDAGQARDEHGRYTAADNGEEDGVGGDDIGEDGAPQQETAEQRLARLEQEAQQWQHRYQSDLGRQSALQRKIQQLEEENRKLQQRGGLSTTKEGEAGDNPEGSGMSDEAWQAFKEDFPEAAQAMEQQLSTLKTHYESRLQQIESQLSPIQAQAEQQTRLAQEQALEAQHPDWREVIQTPNFHAWLREQPVAVQQFTNSEEAADAAFLLQSFKLSQGQAAPQANQGLQQRRQRQLQAARTVPNRGGRRRSEIPDDDEDALFDYFAEKG